MPKLISFFIFIAFNISLFAQAVNNQSLSYSEIKSLPGNEIKIKAFVAYLIEHPKAHSNSIDPFEIELEQLANKLHRNDLIAELLIAKAIVAVKVNNKKLAITSLNKAETIIPLLNDSLILPLKIKLGIWFIRAGKKSEGQQLLESVKAKNRGSISLESRVMGLMNLSEAYVTLRQYRNALSTFKMAVDEAKSSSNPLLIIQTKLQYVNILFKANETPKAVTLLKEIVMEPLLTYALQVHILSQILINSIKLNQGADLDAYYQKLILLEKKNNIKTPEEYLATGMYKEEKNQYSNAISDFKELFRNNVKATDKQIYLEGLIGEAIVYSKELKKDSADFYFRLAKAQLLPGSKDNADYFYYNKAYRQYQQYIKQNYSSTQNLLRVMSFKDSLNQLDLLNRTSELEYKYKILEDRQQLNVITQQSNIRALSYSRNRQRSLLIILGLSLLVVIGFAFSYFFYQRRKQSAILFAADLKRIKQENHIEVIKALAESQEEERRRIADQLHDEVGSMLSVARLNLSSLEEGDGKDKMISHQKLATSNRILGNVADTIREMSHQLMPVALKQYGLKHAIEQMVNDINISGKIAIEHLVTGLDQSEKFTESFEVNFYRIIQELFQNIIKHSQATNAYFQLVEHSDSINLYIEDNGKGMDVANLGSKGKGFMLLSGRVEYYHGKLTVEGMSGKGTVIIIDIPTKNILKKHSEKFTNE